MAKTFSSEKQEALFKQLSQYQELIFATGSKACAANLVGKFTVNRNHLGDDQLDVDDGTHHVHIDWTCITRCEVGDFHGEGMLTFFDGETVIFRFYNHEGPFSKAIESFSGELAN